LTAIFRTDGEKEKKKTVVRIPEKIFRFGRSLPEPEEIRYEGSVSRTGRPPPGGSACRRYYGRKIFNHSEPEKITGTEERNPDGFEEADSKDTSRHC